ncbi:MAG: hypothetical protein KBS86_03390 [Proteobacteria bacterium]|nr:hypothetical protein [Candidatus Enterousia scatequi]
MTTNSVYESLMKQAKDAKNHVLKSIYLKHDAPGGFRKDLVKYNLSDPNGMLIVSVVGMDGENGLNPKQEWEEHCGVFVDNTQIELTRGQYFDLFGQLGYRFALPQILKNKQNA